MNRKAKPKETFLESAIRLRENAIKRLESRKVELTKEADDKKKFIDGELKYEREKIEKRIANSRVLLKALQDGSLAP